MGRFLAGVASALLLAAAGLFFWKGQERTVAATPAPSLDAPIALADIPEAPSAPERTKEQKRFDRYDKDRNGAVSQAEYLANRRKAYERLDTNGDGVVSFSEYAQKTVRKFAGADRDKSGVLSRTEFATTRVVRKARPKPDCPPPLTREPLPQPAEDDEA